MIKIKNYTIIAQQKFIVNKPVREIKRKRKKERKGEGEKVQRKGLESRKHLSWNIESEVASN